MIRLLIFICLVGLMSLLVGCGPEHNDYVENSTFVAATKACEQAGQKLMTVGQTKWRRDERIVYAAYCTSGVTVRGEFRQ